MEDSSTGINDDGDGTRWYTQPRSENRFAMPSLASLVVQLKTSVFFPPHPVQSVSMVGGSKWL